MAKEAILARAETPEVPDDERSGAAALRTLCPARHDLLRFVVPWSGDFCCDRCLQDIAGGGIMWSCRCCRYDVCDACSWEGPGCLGAALHGAGASRASPSSCGKGPRASAPGSFRQAEFVARHVRPGQCFAYRYDSRPGGYGSVPMDGGLGTRSLSSAKPAEQEAQHGRKPVDYGGFAVPSSQLTKEWALQTVNAATAELARLMDEVQRAPREEKKVLLTKAALLEATGEYAAALEHLQREPPFSNAGTDPLGGSMLV